MPEYRIKAMYSETKRKRTTMLVANDTTELHQILKDSGFVEPFEIENLPDGTINAENYDEPTEKQIDYATDLGIEIPQEISRKDLSRLISIYEDDDNPANPDLIEFALNRNIITTKYIGKNALYNHVWDTLQGIDKIAFFVFCVYRFCSDDRRGNLDTHPYKGVFYNIANELSSDDDFLRSMNKYYGSDIKFFGQFTVRHANGDIVSTTGGSAKTTSYKAVCNCLKRDLNVDKVISKTMRDKYSKNSEKSLKPWVIVLIIMAFFLVLKYIWIAAIAIIPVIWFYFKYSKKRKIVLTIIAGIVFAFSLYYFIYTLI